MKNKWFLLASIIMVASMMLAACGTTPTATTAAATEAPMATSVPVRHGGWLDEIVFSVVSGDAAVTQLQAGAIDLYANGLASADLPSIQQAGLSYASSSGLYYDILYNPAVFTDTSVLNPFSDRKIREATEWLYDRNYINQEVYAGGGLVKYFAFETNGPDYADLADVAASLESKYAYNFDLANSTIKTEMTSLGATQDANGKWQYKGQPVTLKFLIRNDGDGTRKPLGDYVANQLEKVGFTVDRQYKKSSEASPLWIESDPKAGEWSMYTAAWSNTAIERDGKGDFQQMYLPDSIQGMSVFMDNVPDPAFQKVGDDLINANYKDLTERHDMMAQAMTLSLQDSLQVFLIDGKNYIPYSTKVQATSDLAAGIEGAQIWPETLRFKDQVGGTLKWGDQDLFGDPWNPIAGSNWTYDRGAQTATQSGALMADPYTGLQWPWRAEKADLQVDKSIVVGKTLDWVNLTTVDSIVPPADAWIDWDAKAQKFVTVGDAANLKATLDKFTSELTTAAAAVDFTKLDAAALTKFLTDQGSQYATITGATPDVATAVADKDTQSAIGDEATKIAGMSGSDQQAELVSYVTGFIGPLDPSNTYELGSMDLSSAKIMSRIYYPADLFTTVKWHDGSALSVGDFIMGMILTFDRAKLDSPIYDPQAVPLFQSFMQSFKGFKIESTDPLVIDTWSNTYYQDAELNITPWWPGVEVYGSVYQYGEAGWDIMAVADLAEADGKMAWSSDKATAKNIDQTNFVSGDTLGVLSTYLDQAASEKYIPYAPTMSAYVTADEAATRYANLQAWYTAHNHFWVGTGPYYLDTVSPVEKSLVLKNYSDYADPVDRWSSQFAEPMLASVDITGPSGQVKIGDTATFNVAITFQGQPYPNNDLKMVKYMVYDATGNMVVSDLATAVSDGSYQVVLSSDVTSKLAAGSNKLTVAVVPIPVAVPTFASVQFVTGQ
ncbi:MAG TPA: ABC transporter substrate-binding protein [Longilinea sp.]|nr:ABC transporter substrate-binding protein [Longilinea sp.]